MKKFAVVVALLAVAGCDGGAESAGGIQWRDGGELDAAFAEAKSSGQPVVVYFTAVW